MLEPSRVHHHPDGSYVATGTSGPVVHTPGSAGVALDDMLCRLWQWADGRTTAELAALPLFANQRLLRGKLAALRAAGLLLPPLDLAPAPAAAPPPDAPLVSVIIVSRNGWPHLQECLPSVLAQTYPRLEVILVDEQSTDGTLGQVRRLYPTVRVVSQPGAPNFAAGCNLGLRQAEGQWLFFLNNDTVLDPACVTELMAAQAGRSGVAGVAAMLRFYANRPFVNGLGTYVPPAGHGYDLGIGSLDVGQYDRQAETAFLCFGAALVARAALEKVGLLDERYGFYYEDVDWGYRARAAGWQLLAAPRARVYHKFGASMSGLPSTFKARLATRNRLRFAAKNLPPAAAARRLLTATLEDAGTMGDYLRRGQGRLALALARGWLEFGAALPGVLWQRTPRHGPARRPVDLAGIASQFPAPALQGPFPRLTEEAVESRYAAYLGRAPGEEPRPRLLIISPDTVGSSMGGVGMRYWELSGQLAQAAQVTLAIPAASDLAPRDFAMRTYTQGQAAGLLPLVDEADFVLLSGFIVYHHPALRHIAPRIIVDLYDPTVLENLALFADRPLAEQQSMHDTGVATYNELLSLGDYFICASEKQRDFWLGALTAANRVDPAAYAGDPTLRRLIDVVPFGLPAQPPQHTRPVLKGVVPGIGSGDKVILWGGGIWDWLDPLTAIQAMPAVLAAVPEARLFFLGTRHPNPAVPPSRMAEAAISCAQALGLRDRAVFFNDWVAYADRANYLREADLGISLHGDHIETRFAVRTRLMDYLWAGLPMVISGGDTLSDLVQARGLGIVVAPGNVAGVAAALVDLLEHPIAPEHFQPVAEAFYWPRVAAPLLAYLRTAAPSTPRSRSQPIVPAAAAALPPTPAWGLLPKAYAALRSRGLAGLARDVRSYVIWRLARSR